MSRTDVFDGITLVLVGLGVLVLIFSGCDQVTRAVTPAPAVAAPVPPPVEIDKRIPDVARQWERYGIRVWRFYFARAEPPSIIFAQIHQESRWRCDAVSPVGASGCGQFMPKTAEWIQTLLPEEVRAECPETRGCPNDPKWAIQAAAKYDYLLWKGLADVEWADDRWAMALVAYNGGEGWVRRERAEAIRRGLDPSIWWGGIERVCLRAEWACKESRGYPVAILRKWKPIYDTWLPS